MDLSGIGNWALAAIVVVPLIGALLNGVFGKHMDRYGTQLIAVGSVLVSFAFAVVCFLKLHALRELSPEENVRLVYHWYDWFSINTPKGPTTISVKFAMDALNGVMALVVTGIGSLIHIYSVGYMSEEKSYARFFCYLNLFTASMLILILGSSLPLMFVGWEGVGLCSYLLIGFWYETPAYAAAGRKAFVANRIGDFGVLLGMFMLVAVCGSFEFDVINQNAYLLTGGLDLGSGPMAISVATVATLFLFLGCTGKSAQLPLYVWLPDAMAGPTPVSALIHAATMVTAGIYLICRLSPVFALAPATMAVIATIGALTAFMAATIALVQVEIKKVLAYSTVSQLGFMFAAVGCGAFAAGFFHVFTHAFFKACLFLGAGSVMHAVGAHGDADITKLGGLRKYMPTTRWTFLVSCAAIAGIPGFSGFFSKDEVLVGALSVGHYFTFAPWLGYVVFGLLIVAATMTAFYMFRLYFLTFSGEYRGGPDHGDAHAHDDHGHDAHAAGHDAHGHGEPHESPGAMTFPLVVLAVGAIFGGYLWVGLVNVLNHDAHFEPWVTWLEPALGSIGHADHSNAIYAVILGTAAGLIGWFWARAWYFTPNESPARLAAAWPRLHQFLFDKWRVDELYDATILAGSRGLGLVMAGFDKAAVDGLFAKATATGVQAASFAFTRIQNGVVHSYGAVMVVGMLGIAWWFMVPHVKLHASEPTGTEVKFVAGAGLGYEYRWDFDSDGEYDTEWTAERTQTHDYAGKNLSAPIVVFFTPASGGTFGAEPRALSAGVGDVIHLNANELGAWQKDADQATLPYLQVREDGLYVRANSAKVRDGMQPTDAELTIGPGRSVRIGDARLTIGFLARATVRVRNAFGYERTTTRSLNLRNGGSAGETQAHHDGGSAEPLAALRAIEANQP